MSIELSHLESIIKAAEDDSLSIFVGAGVSKSIESEVVKVPTWSDLINDLKLDLSIDYELDYLKVAQLYYLEFGEHTYYKKVKSYFPDTLPPSKLHEVIFNLKPHSIITTNWDNILETTILENAYIYDVISCDNDLMKSRLDKKLIKMHGDFRNHNIVFKEDDYINYEYNFPLVSNYIKSIISTHTIMFIGYSYNDFDIKQIIKWAQNHSSVRPPMYLVVFDEDFAQRKYLASHGITTILAKEIDCDYFNDDRSNKLYSLLHAIKERNISNETGPAIISKIYSRLENLNYLESILAEHVLKCLGDCGLVYSSHEERATAFLTFYDTEVSIKSNDSNRKLYGEFVNILSENDISKKYDDMLTPLFKILHKADISGIVIDKRKNVAVLTSEIVNGLTQRKASNIFTFNINNVFDYGKKRNQATNSFYENIDPYDFFQKNQYKMAFLAVDSLIKYQLKNKHYASLLISLLNHNMILRILKYTPGLGGDFNGVPFYEIEDKFDNFPKGVRKNLHPVLDMVTGRYMFDFIYAIDKILTYNKEISNKKSSFHWSSEEFKAEFMHLNILNFIKMNGCLIDSYEEFKYAIDKLIEIKVLKQKSRVDKGNVNFTIEEIYSIIKYIPTKKLKEMFKYKKRDKFISLELNSESKEWLIKDAFGNLSEFCLNNNEHNGNGYEELRNVILLISFLGDGSVGLEYVSDRLLKLVLNKKTSVDILEAIVEYTTISYNKNKDSIDNEFVAKFIDEIIDRIVSEDSNLDERVGFVTNGLRNIFIIASSIGVEINNNENLIKILDRVDRLSLESKVRTMETVLYHIFLIGSDEIKNKIKEYMLSLPIENLSQEKKIKTKLFLVAAEINQADADLAIETLDVIRSMPTNRFDYWIYSLRNLLDFIVVKLNKDEFAIALSEVKNKIESYEKS